MSTIIGNGIILILFLITVEICGEVLIEFLKLGGHIEKGGLK